MDIVFKIINTLCLLIIIYMMTIVINLVNKFEGSIIGLNSNMIKIESIVTHIESIIDITDQNMNFIDSFINNQPKH